MDIDIFYLFVIKFVIKLSGKNWRERLDKYHELLINDWTSSY